MLNLHSLSDVPDYNEISALYLSLFSLFFFSPSFFLVLLSFVVFHKDERILCVSHIIVNYLNVIKNPRHSTSSTALCRFLGTRYRIMASSDLKKTLRRSLARRTHRECHDSAIRQHSVCACKCG